MGTDVKRVWGDLSDHGSADYANFALLSISKSSLISFCGFLIP